MENKSNIYRLFDDLSKLSRVISHINLPEVWHGELQVLQHLQQHRGETVLPVDLKNALELTSARVSSLLNTLERKGYVSRAMAKEDRRKVLVTITTAGEGYYEGQMAALIYLVGPVFAALGEEDTAALARITARLLEILRGMAAAAAQNPRLL